LRQYGLECLDIILAHRFWQLDACESGNIILEARRRYHVASWRSSEDFGGGEEWDIDFGAKT